MVKSSMILRGFWGAAALAAALAGAAAPAIGAPAVGDTYTYRLVNGYNKEVRGQLRYEVSSVGADRISYAVTPDNAEGGSARTEVYTNEGNWLRAPVESHGEPVEYEFAPAFPALVFPLDPGKEWSVRVKASVAGDRRGRSVRVDGKVLGAERVRVPAGEYDAVKVKRLVYPGDAVDFLLETRVEEIDWYVPALGRVVRSERRSDWMDMSKCTRAGGCGFRGNWNVIELVEMRPGGR
jgi:hypothetical protein